MKMFLGDTPIQSMNVHRFEISTDDATVVPSDLQAGVTCYARNKKVVGTGKSFEFAVYGTTTTNMPEFMPTLINVVQISSLEHPIKSSMTFTNMVDMDFSTEQTIGFAIINGVEYPIVAQINGNILTFNCEKEVTLEFFYGRDNYT